MAAAWAYKGHRANAADPQGVAESEGREAATLGGQAVRRALRIIGAFTIDEPEMGVSEIARRVNLPKSTVHRLLSILCEEGFLVQDGPGPRYRLGVRFFHLGSIVQSAMDLKRVAKPWMERLRDKYGETVNMYVLDGYDRVCIEKAEGRYLVRQVIQLGQKIPAYCGAAGKVLVAWQDPAFVEEMIRATGLRPLTRQTISDPERFMEELRRIRESGYGVSDGERDAEVVAVAAPVFDLDSNVVAALSISGPRSRFVISREVIEAVRDGAERISRELGHGRK